MIRFSFCFRLTAVFAALASAAFAASDKIKVLIVDGQNNHQWATTTPMLKRILEELYNLHEIGHAADLDGLRLKLSDRPDLLDAAARLQYVGRQMSERPEWLKRIVSHFAEHEKKAGRNAVHRELAATSDEGAAMALLRKLQGSKAPASGAA